MTLLEVVLFENDAKDSEYELRNKENFLLKCRGYQRIGENVTKGTPDMHEAIDVSLSLYGENLHICSY